MALMTVQTDGGTGTTVTFGAANSSDTVPCDGRTALLVVNGAGAPITVTVTSRAVARLGTTATDKAVTVAAGATKLISLDQGAFAATDTGLATVGYSSTTTITSAAIRI